MLAFFSSDLMAKTENYLRHTKIKNHKLELTFKYNIGNVKHFTIRRNGVVKHVYDIKNTSLPSSLNLSKYRAKGVKAFRIGQFNKKTIRVVIETTSFTKGKYGINGKRLTMQLPLLKGKVTPTKRTTTRRSYVKPKTVKKYGYNSRRASKVIILDAGHGGRDIGASGKGIREKDLTLKMTLKLKRVLQKMGYKVLLTRYSDKFMNLRQRTEFANRNKGSLFISMHANAAPVKRNPRVRYQGIEIFYLSIKNSKRIKDKRAVYRGKKLYTRSAYKQMTSRSKYVNSHRLARGVKRNILKSVQKKYGIYDKGVKRQDFWVLLATKMPSILVEVGYLTHSKELKRLKNPKYQNLMVEGIAKGVNAYYGLY